KAGFFEMVQQGLEEFPARFVNGGGGALVNPDPRVHECTEEPRPDPALMIRAIAFAYSALVTRRIARLAGGPRAQAQRRPEMILPRFDNEEGAVVFNQAQRQAADGEDLIRPKSGIDVARLMIHIDHVEEHFTFGVPETVLKRFHSALPRLLPTVVVL